MSSLDNTTHQGSTNQGIHEARNNNFASPQGSGESATAYQNRMNAYWLEKQNQNK